MFMGENEAGLSVEWLPGRLRELRLEFDYTIVHGPPGCTVQRRRIAGLPERRSRSGAGGEFDAAGCGPESSPGAAGHQCATAGIGFERANISDSGRNLPETVETDRNGCGRDRKGFSDEPPPLSLHKTERRGWGTLLIIAIEIQALKHFAENRQPNRMGLK